MVLSLREEYPVETHRPAWPGVSSHSHTGFTSQYIVSRPSLYFEFMYSGEGNICFKNKKFCGHSELSLTNVGLT